jgi:hypothetical protein
VFLAQLNDFDFTCVGNHLDDGADWSLITLSAFTPQLLHKLLKGAVAAGLRKSGDVFTECGDLFANSGLCCCNFFYKSLVRLSCVVFVQLVAHAVILAAAAGRFSNFGPGADAANARSGKTDIERVGSGLIKTDGKRGRNSLNGSKELRPLF